MAILRREGAKLYRPAGSTRRLVSFVGGLPGQLVKTVVAAGGLGFPSCRTVVVRVPASWNIRRGRSGRMPEVMANMDDMMDNMMDQRFRNAFHRAVIVHRFRLGRGVRATENRVPLAAIVLLGARPGAPPRPQMLVAMVRPEGIIHVGLQCLETIGALGAVVVRVRDMDVMHAWDGHRKMMVAVPGLVVDVAHVAYVTHVIQFPSRGRLLLD
mmetsp:Transcript_55197/g.113972  ORF Transcript_55197/g.113972 Transcript_55197/m.113972 type:complete len:212 (+) Transcript_55197:235-870(+)